MLPDILQLHISTPHPLGVVSRLQILPLWHSSQLWIDSRVLSVRDPCILYGPNQQTWNAACLKAASAVALSHLSSCAKHFQGVRGCGRQGTGTRAHTGTFDSFAAFPANVAYWGHPWKCHIWAWLCFWVQLPAYLITTWGPKQVRCNSSIFGMQIH